MIQTEQHDTTFYSVFLSNGCGLLDKASRMLVRTNPKLATNVKIMTNGKKVWLESYDADKHLSNDKYKAFLVNPDSHYNKDVVSFYDKLDSVVAFKVLQEYDDLSVKDTFDEQYETFYHCGCEYVKSLDYDEQFGFVAPLWVDEKIPDYFVVFKVSEPSYTKTDVVPLQDLNFKRDIFDKCTIIKTFSLKDDSPIGKYIRNYRNQENFPVSPLYARMEKNGHISFNGISYKTGEFTEAHEHDFEKMFCKDDAITSFDNFITGGFERNGIICANILNLEFLFDDTTSDDYTMNRYFGLYCNFIEDGVLQVNYSGFSNLDDGGNQKYAGDVLGLDRFMEKPVIALNNNGVVFPHLHDINNIPLFPSYNNLSIDGNDTISCVTDRLGNFHRIGVNYYDDDELRLTDKKVILTDFNGFVKTNRSVSCEYEDNITPAQVVITINSNIPCYTRIELHNDLLAQTLVGYIEANELRDDNPPHDVISRPGWYDYDTFSGSGDMPDGTETVKSLSDVAEAMAKSFNSVFDVGLHAYYCENKVIIVACNASESYNAYHINIVGGGDSVSVLNSGYLCGANSYPHIKIMEKYSDLLQVGEYMRTKTTRGYGKIIAKSIDLETAIIDGDHIAFENGLYYDVLIDDNSVFVNRTNTASVYDEFNPVYGRLSFFPVHDFDFQTTTQMTQYGDFGELEYEREYLEEERLSSETTGSYDALTQYEINSENPEFSILLNFETDDVSVIDVDSLNIEAQDDEYYNVTFYLSLLNGLYDSNDTSITPDFDFVSLMSDLDGNYTVKSEYGRLYENFSNDFMFLSKTAPYINKWVYHDNGFDVRENKYRLNTNPVFGMNSFAPDPYTFNDVSNNPNGFGCEWYYLFEDVPCFYSGADVDYSRIWSYIGEEAPIDSANNPNIEEKLLDTDKDYFNIYFVRDHIYVIEDNNVNGFFDTLDYVKKYSLIENGSAKTFPETFFRGAKIEFLQKDNYAEKIENNLNTISVKSDTSLNGYRFTSVVIPIEQNIRINNNELPSSLNSPKIVVVRNDVFKFVVMLIYVVRKYGDALEYLNHIADANSNDNETYFDSGCITRYLLYNPNTKLLNSDIEPIVPSGTDCLTVRGCGTFKIDGGVISGDGNTRFTSEITSDDNVIIAVKRTGGYIQYELFKPNRIDDDRTMVVGQVTTHPIANMLNGWGWYRNYNITECTDYYIVDCDVTIFSEYYKMCDFFNIMNRVNHASNDDIVYVHIDSDGRTHRNDCSDANKNEYSFALRFVMPSDNAKYEYLDYSYDGERVSYFDNPKYAFRMQRYGGWFEPLTKPVLYFKDPFVSALFGDMTDYMLTALRTSRFMNTCFAWQYNGFGMVKQMAYHRANDINNNPFKLNDDEKPIYPVSNRFAIGYVDMNVFRSSWDPWYFVKTNSNTDEVYVHGTCSMLEKKAFLASKCMTLPDDIVIEKFAIDKLVGENYKSDENHTIFYEEKQSNVSYTIMVERRIKQYMHDKLKSYFEEYVNDIYSYGDKTTVEDDIDRYVEQNILPLYMFDHFDLYVHKTPNGNKREMNYTYVGDSDAVKYMHKLRTDNTYGLSVVDYSEFDRKIVFNTKDQYTYEIALSLHIKKR